MKRVLVRCRWLAGERPSDAEFVDRDAAYRGGELMMNGGSPPRWVPTTPAVLEAIRAGRLVRLDPVEDDEEETPAGVDRTGLGGTTAKPRRGGSAR